MQISWKGQQFVDPNVQQRFLNSQMQISWRAQHFVSSQAQISWHGQRFVSSADFVAGAALCELWKVHISWQAQHFVSSQVQISW